MSPAIDNSEILREKNYFVCESTAKQTFLCWDKSRIEDLLGYVVATNAAIEDDNKCMSSWEVEDMKAYAIICTMISPSLMMMVRNALSTLPVWEILKTFFGRQVIET